MAAGWMTARQAGTICVKKRDASRPASMRASRPFLEMSGGVTFPGTARWATRRSLEGDWLHFRAGDPTLPAEPCVSNSCRLLVDRAWVLRRRRRRLTFRKWHLDCHRLSVRLSRRPNYKGEDGGASRRRRRSATSPASAARRFIMPPPLCAGVLEPSVHWPSPYE